ncbi:MAG TPA: c-type cytochrome [Methylomirabilota bacterium]|nr:c-type cytochrome [Methylomirabilota bacterium]
MSAPRRGWLGAGLGLALVALAGTASGQPLFSPAQDPLAGSRLFSAKGCVKCHAVSGIGGTIGPDLGRIARPRTFFDLAAGMWNHAPRMAERMRQLAIARPRLDARETGDLVGFLFSVDYFDPLGRPEVGRRLFADKRCVVCHQVGGAGGVIGPSLDALGQYASPIYLATAMWNHGPPMADAMRARRIPRPFFGGTELGDLLAYISSASPGVREGPLYVLPGRADEGRRLFAQKRCLDCHSVQGQGGRVGPDLAERSRSRSLGEFTAAMWNKAPAMMEAMKTRSVPVPQLKPEEMADIVAYLYSVRYFALGGDPRQGTLLAASKGCLGCHAIGGERGKPASDLSRARDLDSPAAVLSALWNHAFITPAQPGRAKTAWAEISAQEMANLTAFLQSLRRSQ